MNDDAVVDLSHNNLCIGSVMVVGSAVLEGLRFPVVAAAVAVGVVYTFCGVSLYRMLLKQILVERAKWFCVVGLLLVKLVLLALFIALLAYASGPFLWSAVAGMLCFVPAGLAAGVARAHAD